MPRYAAFLRGVSPLNAKMPELKSCFEKSGFKNVATVLSSGNVVFDAPKTAEKTLEKKIEAALEEHLGRKFATIVRSLETLQEILDSDPFKEFRLKPGAKRVVTLLRHPLKEKKSLPIEKNGAQILKVDGNTAFTAYVPDPKKGGLFMVLIESTFGKDVTTRTWETIQKVVKK